MGLPNHARRSIAPPHAGPFLCRRGRERDDAARHHPARAGGERRRVRSRARPGARAREVRCPARARRVAPPAGRERHYLPRSGRGRLRCGGGQRPRHRPRPRARLRASHTGGVARRAVQRRPAADRRRGHVGQVDRHRHDRLDPARLPPRPDRDERGGDEKLRDYRRPVRQRAGRRRGSVRQRGGRKRRLDRPLSPAHRGAQQCQPRPQVAGRAAPAVRRVHRARTDGGDQPRQRGRRGAGDDAARVAARRLFDQGRGRAGRARGAAEGWWCRVRAGSRGRDLRSDAAGAGQAQRLQRARRDWRVGGGGGAGRGRRACDRGVHRIETPAGAGRRGGGRDRDRRFRAQPGQDRRDARHAPRAARADADPVPAARVRPAQGDGAGACRNLCRAAGPSRPARASRPGLSGRHRRTGGRQRRHRPPDRRRGRARSPRPRPRRRRRASRRLR